MSIKLKPCPFCGGEAEIKEHNQCFSTAYSVVCKDKNCRGRSAKPMRILEVAVYSWNRRTGNEPIH